MKNSQEIDSLAVKAKDFAPLPQDYSTWSAQKKQDFLWNERIVPSIYERKPPLAKVNTLGLIMTRLKIKMDRLSDQAPAKWDKAIHARGSVAKIKLIAEADCPFTGLFQGADYGLLRASLTGDPSRDNFAPGLGIKLLVDAQDSGNFSALVSLVGQGKNYNFLANEFSNIVPVVNQLRPKIGNLIFRRVTRYPTKISLKNLGVIDQLGNPVKVSHYPEQIFLVPTSDIQFPESPHDFRDDLETIPSGTVLFSLYAVESKEGENHLLNQSESRQQAQRIGRIETTSKFVTSAYGDRQLFFRHQRFRNQ
ncbi:MAG: hypothetical protein QNJ65_09325 [Xenococcaceae cyanobacterium MO_234.B1]|nr:hypothetical protein [Xenococcaceae cyanobacterium MO_234.B1]